MTFGTQLKLWRTEAGLTQLELAQACDLPYVSKIETGRLLPPSRETILKIAAKLGRDPDPLIRLAGKVPEDVKEILWRCPSAIRFLRAMKKMDEKHVEKLLLALEKLIEEQKADGKL